LISFPGPVSALVELQVAADQEGIARVLHLEELVHRSIGGIRATVPAYNRLLVEGSPESWDPERINAELSMVVTRSIRARPRRRSTERVSLPVCYDPELGLDLEDVAVRIGVTPLEVTTLHSARTYTVLATGFAPGWAYLGDTHPSLALPRRSTPRRLVPVGSVGIADRRTGVYPVDGPGGWRILGRVPPTYFRDVKERVARFRVGADVRFEPISVQEYQAAGG